MCWTRKTPTLAFTWMPTKQSSAWPARTLPARKNFWNGKPCRTRTITPPKRKLTSMPITRLRWMSYPRKRPPFLPWMSAWSRRMTGQRQSTAASERSRRFGSTWRIRSSVGCGCISWMGWRLMRLAQPRVSAIRIFPRASARRWRKWKNFSLIAENRVQKWPKIGDRWRDILHEAFHRTLKTE